MNEEKTVAKTVKKFYAGRAGENDFRFLVNYFMANSSLGKSLDDNIPGIRIVNDANWNGATFTKGEYEKGSNRVNINGTLVKEACKGKIDVLVDLIDTFGHESTHYYQYLKGENHEIGRLYEENVKKMLGFAGCTADEINSNLDLIKKIAHGSYLALPHEKDARDGGKKFISEAIDNLFENEYLDEKIKQKIKEESQFKNDVDKEVEKTCVEKYERFIDFLKSRDVRDFMNEKESSIKDEEGNLDKMLEIWLKDQDSKMLLKNYQKLIGSGNEFDVVRIKLAKAINSDRVSKEERERYTSKIVSSLKEDDMGEEFYEKELKDILNNKQILEVYDSLLKKDLKNINCSLFDCNPFDQKDELVWKKGKLIAENFDHIINNMSTYDSQTFKRLDADVTKALRRKNNLDGDVINKLEDLKECINKRIESNEKVKSTTGR